MKYYDISQGVMIYYLPKELDHYAAENIKKNSEFVFDEDVINYIIFDFQNTEFMDSSGIGLLTGRFRRVHDEGGRAFIINSRENIDKILTMSGIYTIISKMDSKESIIQELLEGGYYE